MKKISVYLQKIHDLEGCEALYITVLHSMVSPMLEARDHWNTKQEQLILMSGRQETSQGGGCGLDE